MLPRRADKTTEQKINEEVNRSDGQDVDNMKHQTSSLIPPNPPGCLFLGFCDRPRELLMQ